MFSRLSNAEWLFLIVLFSLALVYWVGFTKDVPVGTNALVQLWYAISGRNARGNYPNYPK